MNFDKSLYQDLSKYPPLAAEEEKELIEKYILTKDQSIRNKLVQHNLRLVMKIVNEYPNSNYDLFVEGCLGLIVGIERFDPSKGIRLSTYSAYWIRAYVFDYIIKNAKMIRVVTTSNQRKLFFNLNKEKARLEAQGIEITPEIIAEHLQVRPKDVVEMEQRMSQVHLDTPSNEPREKITSSINLLKSNNAGPDEELENAEFRDRLVKEFDEFKKNLKEKERKIFDLRMVEDKTLQEVGESLGLTRERVRQIQSSLEDKLKKFCSNRGLAI